MLKKKEKTMKNRKKLQVKKIYDQYDCEFSFTLFITVETQTMARLTSQFTK